MNASSNEPLCNSTLCFVKDYLAGEGQIEMSTTKPQKHPSKEMKARAVWGGSEWNTQHHRGGRDLTAGPAAAASALFRREKGKEKAACTTKYPSV